MAKRKEEIPYDENDAKLLAGVPAEPTPTPSSLGNAMAALWEKEAEKPAAPPVEKEAPPAGVSMADAFNALWSAVDRKSEAPKANLLPQPPPQPTFFPPVLEDVLPVNGEQRPYKELGSERIRKALWAGKKPEPDDLFTLTTCSECRKDMWTRVARENICEECFLAIHTQMEMDMKAHHAQGFVPGSGIVNPLMR